MITARLELAALVLARELERVEAGQALRCPRLLVRAASGASS